MTYNELSDFIKSHDEKESQSEMIKAFMMSEITSKEMDKLKDQLDAKNFYAFNPDFDCASRNSKGNKPQIAK